MITQVSQLQATIDRLQTTANALISENNTLKSDLVSIQSEVALLHAKLGSGVNTADLTELADKLNDMTKQLSAHVSAPLIR